LHQAFELGEQSADLTGEQVRLGARKRGIVIAIKGRQPGLDAPEHLTGDLACALGVAQQVLDLTMYELTALGQLIAGAVLQVVTQAPGLGLAGAAGEVSVLNEIGQPGVCRLRVELDPLFGQRGCHLGRGPVRQQAGKATGEGAHNGDVLRGLLVHRVAQGLEADAVDRRRETGPLLGLGVGVGHARNPTRNVRQGVCHPAAAGEVSHPSAAARRHRPATDILTASNRDGLYVCSHCIPPPWYLRRSGPR